MYLFRITRISSLKRLQDNSVLSSTLFIYASTFALVTFQSSLGDKGAEVEALAAWLLLFLDPAGKFKS